MLTVKHPFFNPKGDGVDTTVVRPSDWNASHSLTGQVAFSELGGNIAVGQMASGSGASLSTYWRGDGTWATPASGGTPGGSSGQLQWNSAGVFAGFGNWNGTAIFEQRNVTNAQTFRVYNTYTDASNYERGVVDWTTTPNTLTIGTQAAGTGAARDLIVRSKGYITLQSDGGAVSIINNLGNVVSQWYQTAFIFSNNLPVGWGSSTSVGGVADVNLSRVAAGVLQIGDSSSAGINANGILKCASVTLGADPTIPLGAATKQYVDAHAGGSGTPGGANTNVQFNSSSAFGGDSGFTYAGNGRVTHALGTITATAKALSITGTWNNAGVVFDAPLFMNITDMASAALSKYLEIQYGGVTEILFDRGDGGYFGPGIYMYNAGSGVKSGIWTSRNQGAGLFMSGNVGGQAQAVIHSLSGIPQFDLSGGAALGWQPAGPPAQVIQFDTALWRDGSAGVIAQRNSTNAQSFRVYNTYTDASNYERGVFDWTTTANTLTIGTQAAGTGTHRTVNLSSCGNNSISIVADGAGTTLTNTSYDLHEFSLKASGGTSGSVRYEHRSGSMVHSANNALGELQVGAAGTNYVQGLWSPNTITIGGGVAGSFQPFIYPDYRVSRTANLTLVGTATTASPTTDTGTSYDNNGAAGEVDFTLPTAGGANAPAGTKYSFYVAVAQLLKIIAHAGDTIRIAGSVSTSGGNASASTIGNYLEIVVVAANKWAAKATQGTWTVA